MTFYGNGLSNGPPCQMSNFSKAILIAFGTIFCVVGSLALFRPDLLTEPVQITLPTASAKAEFRAAYGGMFLGLSAAAIGAVRQPHHARFVVMILVIVLGVFQSLVR